MKGTPPVRRLRLSLKGQEVLLLLRGASAVLSFDEVPSYTFDGEGRLFAAFEDGVLYRRSLDGRVQARWREGGEKVRRFLPWEEGLALQERIRRRVREVREALEGRRGEDWAEGAAFLDRVLRWTPAALEAETRRYREVYRPIGILPPDQYLAVVLQVTEGCSWNRCTFCEFYRDRPFRVRPPEELRAHIEAVRAFFGRALGMRKTLFLADANALIVPQRQLLPLVRQVAAAFPIAPPAWPEPMRLAWARQGPRFQGIYAFLDAFGGTKKGAEEYAELHALGVQRVYIGLETGHDPLLAFLEKPGTAEDALEAVRALKAAGVGVGIIVMVGVGGDRFAEAHVRDTVRIVGRMPLDERDLIYLSPFVEHPGGEYARRRQALGFRNLTPQEMAAQEAALRRGLPFRGRRAPRLSRYDIREFLY